MLVKTDHTVATATRTIGDLLGLYKHKKKKARIHYISVSVPALLWVCMSPGKRHGQVHSYQADFQPETPIMLLTRRSLDRRASILGASKIEKGKPYP